MAKALAFIVLLLISPAAYAATTHTVGGTSGWTDGFDYDNWANGETFTTGDTLVFSYAPNHALDEVNQADYQSCNTGNPINSYSSSPTRVALSSAGTRYFICPRSNHCSRGQKLTVTTTAASTTPSPPSGTTPSPPSGTTPSPPSGTTPSPPSGSPDTPSTPTPTGAGAPPPPTGGAASIMSGWNSLMIVLSLVLAALLGLMG